MKKTILTIPKNCRIDEFVRFLKRVGIACDPPIPKGGKRNVRVGTNHPDLNIPLVKNWDVVPLVEFRAADLALIGSDVVMELDTGEVPLLDLTSGRCRHPLAATWVASAAFPPPGRLRIVTTYPTITSRYFRERDIDVVCVTLRGGVEIGPVLGLGDWIVDIVATGSTLREHRLVEIRKNPDVSVQLVANEVYLPQRSAEAASWVEVFRSAAASGARGPEATEGLSVARVGSMTDGHGSSA